MKPLDEVIKAMENCYGPDAECCDKCQYTKEISAGSICLKCNLEDDALHYLKEYQERQENLDQFETYQFAQNLPLSWDELKQMEGKPAWVEADDGKYKNWFIVGNFFSKTWSEKFDAHVNLYRYGSATEMSKEMYGFYWQAYRKERE
jgi:hypothetical protein